MKRLIPPNVNDLTVLDNVAGTICDGIEDSEAVLAQIRAAYASYRLQQGDPHSVVAAGIPQEVGDRLKDKYSQPLVSMGYIEQIRYKLSPDSCPMCGSHSPSGTVDHYLPKTTFPELSVYSWNLIPACGCNSLRGTEYRGTTPGQRPLHPYFDQFLNQRLVYARILPTTNHNFEALNPDVRFEISLFDPQHANALAIEFHVNSVINKTNVDNFLASAWGKVIAAPNRYFGWANNKPASQAALIERLEQDRGTHDLQAGTPNNWRSMLVTGILEDTRIIDALFQHMQTTE